MERKAFAKLNIALKITGTRPDGYHDLDMVFLEVGLADEVSFRKRAEGIRLSCSDPELPVDERNLAYRAAKRMAEAFGIKEGVEIHIDKKIPAQAGLGGGSSDAACVMTAMRDLFVPETEDAVLEKLAEPLGADVPFFIRGGCQRAKGKGEILSDAGRFVPCSILIVKPEASVSTPWAYHAYDGQGRSGAPVDVDSVEKAIRTGDLSMLCEVMGNDLEEPVMQSFPAIRRLREEILSNGADGARMTGSGSAVFGLFSDEKKAAAAADALSSVPEYQCFLTHSAERQ